MEEFIYCTLLFFEIDPRQHPRPFSSLKSIEVLDLILMALTFLSGIRTWSQRWSKSPVSPLSKSSPLRSATSYLLHTRILSELAVRPGGSCSRWSRVSSWRCVASVAYHLHIDSLLILTASQTLFYFFSTTRSASSSFKSTGASLRKSSMRSVLDYVRVTLVQPLNDPVYFSRML